MEQIELHPVLARLAGLLIGRHDCQRENLYRVHVEVNEAGDGQAAVVCDGKRLIVCSEGVFVAGPGEDLDVPAGLYPNWRKVVREGMTRVVVGETATEKSEARILVNPRLLGEVLICLADLLETSMYDEDGVYETGRPSEITLSVPVAPSGVIQLSDRAGRVRAVVMPIRE